MKKFAIIGSSSSFTKDGYGRAIKDRYGDDCDIFALPSSTILIAVFQLLQRKIVGEYEYVIFRRDQWMLRRH